MYRSLGPVFILLLAMTSVQVGASLAKQLFVVLGSIPTASFRVWVSALLLWLVWRPWRKSRRQRSPWSAQRLTPLALYGISLGCMNLFFYLALERIPLGLAVAVEFVGPLGVALAYSRKADDFMWALFASAGIFLILPYAPEVNARDGLGVVYALIGGLFWALYIWFGKLVSSTAEGLQATAVGMAFASMAILPASATHAAQFPHHPPMAVVVLMVAVAILSSALPYSLEMMALKRLPTKTFGILMSLDPVVATLAGSVLLHEHLSARQLVAIALIVFASLGSTLKGMPGAHSSEGTVPTPEVS